jgi:hypothetical protein
MFFQQFVEFMDPTFQAKDCPSYGAFGILCPGLNLARFEHLNLSLQRRTYLDPILNHIIDCRHGAPPGCTPLFEIRKLSQNSNVCNAPIGLLSLAICKPEGLITALQP